MSEDCTAVTSLTARKILSSSEVDRLCSQYWAPQGMKLETISHHSLGCTKLAGIALRALEIEAGSDGLLSRSVLMEKSSQGTRLSQLQHLGAQLEKPAHVWWSATHAGGRGKVHRPGGVSWATTPHHVQHDGKIERNFRVGLEISGVN